jgi:tRNA-(ms[2]io[6]A)-hydroxylase
MDEAHKQVLGLKLPTDPRWVNLAEMDLAEILSDHAYCEQKAASSFITLIQAYPELDLLVRELAPVVTEEWGHFRMVLAEIDKRQLKLLPQRRDDYVNALIDFQKKGGSKTERLLEKLVTFALVEARSCERFRLLSLYVNDEGLKRFYRNFMEAEALHYKLFLNLSKHYLGEEKTMKRWDEYLLFEENLLKNLEVRGDRMH